MNFQLFDTLECECGQRQLALREPAYAATAAPLPSIDKVLCSKFCGFKHMAITPESVTPADCQKCRATEIVSGAIECSCGRTWPVRDGSPEFTASNERYDDGLRIISIDPLSDPRWRAFVASHPNGTIFHHPAWLRILIREYSRDFVAFACEDQGGRLHGILPLVYTRGLPLLHSLRTTRRLSSLPRTGVAGPLTISALAAKALLRAAVLLAHDEDPIQLEVKTQTAEFDNLIYGLVRADWNPSYILDLPSNPESLQLGDTRSRRHHIRGAIKKALNSGVQVRAAETEAELRQWYSLYLDTMRRRVVPARPYRLFASMWHSLRPRGLMELLIAEKQEGSHARILAGSVFLKFASTVSYSFTGCRREDFAFHPHDLLQWHAIHDSAKGGFQHNDFGEVAGDALLLANFKSKWGAKEVALYRYYYPVTRAMENRTIPLDGAWNAAVRAAWQHLPLRITAEISDVLYSFL